MRKLIFGHPLTLTILAVFVLIFIAFALVAWNLLSYRAIWVYGTNQTTVDWLFINALLLILLCLLITLPAIIVRFYTEVKHETLIHDVERDLNLCGIGPDQVAHYVEEFKKRSSFDSLRMPAAVGVLLIFLGWAFVFIPQGLTGYRDALTQGPERSVIMRIASEQELAEVDTLPNAIAVTHKTVLYERQIPVVMTVKTFHIREFVAFLADESGPLGWVFLGTYFYVLNAIIRRWLLSDIVSGFLWRLNTRLITTFVIGILATALVDDLVVLFGNISKASINYFFFLAGIIPDTFFRWLSMNLTRFFAEADSEGAKGIFASSDLQRKIDGINFWQMHRLFDEGIENVQNLATADISSLLVTVRFNTSRMLDWIDQAILHKHAHRYIEWFHSIGIYTATDLLDIVYYTQTVDNQLDCQRVIEAMQATQPDVSPSILQHTIPNMVRSIEAGPNIKYIQHYWQASVPSLHPVITSRS